MENSLLILVQKINELIQNNFSLAQTLKGITFEVSDALNTSIAIISKAGEVFSYDTANDEKLIYNLKEVDQKFFIDVQLNDQLKNIVETKANISLNSFYIKGTPKAEIKKNCGTILPIMACFERTATCFLYRPDPFTVEELEQIEIINVLISLILKFSQNEEDAEGRRKITIVKSAINTLSFSELEAIIHIFEALGGTEGFLVASRVADQAGITRSVIVNALRKLESAGVIESRSLGMKGTFIKVLNDLLVDEVNKLKR